jgi:hypothetical protein
MLGTHKRTPGTSTNRCSIYNTGIAGANYQNNPNSHKQNNNSPKEDNPAQSWISRNYK